MSNTTNPRRWIVAGTAAALALGTTGLVAAAGNPLRGTVRPTTATVTDDSTETTTDDGTEATTTTDDTSTDDSGTDDSSTGTDDSSTTIVLEDGTVITVDDHGGDRPDDSEIDDSDSSTV